MPQRKGMHPIARGALGLVGLLVVGSIIANNDSKTSPAAQRGEIHTAPKEIEIPLRGDVVYLLKDEVGCHSIETFERLATFARQNDNEAGKSLLTTTFISGECKALEPHKKTFIEDVRVWHDLVCARPEGDPSGCYYIMYKMVQNGKAVAAYEKKEESK
jgi:hypothetical protein